MTITTTTTTPQERAAHYAARARAWQARGGHCPVARYWAQQALLRYAYVRDAAGVAAMRALCAAIATEEKSQ